MGHPDRRIKRQIAKEKKNEESLGKKNSYDNKDLTPCNAVSRIIGVNNRLLYK